MKEMFEKGEKEPRICSAYAREKVKAVAKQKLRLFGATGRNDGVTAAQCSGRIPCCETPEDHAFMGE